MGTGTYLMVKNELQEAFTVEMTFKLDAEVLESGYTVVAWHGGGQFYRLYQQHCNKRQPLKKKRQALLGSSQASGVFEYFTYTTSFNLY